MKIFSKNAVVAIQWGVLFFGVLAWAVHYEASNPEVEIETNLGRVTLELYATESPKTVDNFLTYVNDEHFDLTIFHRVVPGFLIQGGGLGQDLVQKSTREAIANEADNGLKNEKGTLGLARLDDPHSGKDQFYINLVDNEFLNHQNLTPEGFGYTVFGRVTRGMDVIEKIAARPTQKTEEYENLPVDPVIIQSIRIL